VSGLSDVIAIAAGSSHSLAFDRDGNVLAWGYNFFGQLGDGINDDSPVPVEVQFSDELSSDKAITSFSFAGFDPEVVGEIDEGEKTIIVEEPSDRSGWHEDRGLGLIIV
jgi:hypothetical protein